MTEINNTQKKHEKGLSDDFFLLSSDSPKNEYFVVSLYNLLFIILFSLYV